MSVIIEDMTMPECCMKCPMNAGYGCGYMGVAMATKDMESGRHPDCPLGETPEIIHCKDCRWWDKYSDYDNGYCMAAKHGYYSEHWEINIRRTYKGDFYCADAEPKEDAQ